MTYHSGLTFRIASSSKHTKNYSGPPAFTIQWYAMDFPFGAFLPKIIDNLHLEWNNAALAVYTPAIDPNRWTKGEQPVGTITGATFNAYAEWVPQYCQQRPGYQAFDVWDRPELTLRTRRWIPSNTCSSFTEASLVHLWNQAGPLERPSFHQGRAIFRRTYAPMISASEPELVDMTNPQQAQDVRHFYSELETAIRGDAISTQQFLRMLADKTETFYVYDNDSHHAARYYRVELSAPYFGLAQLYQPMTLPWQQERLAAGVFDPQRGGDFATEMSNAVSGTVSLLRRRLPTVLRRKISPTTTIVFLFLLVFLVVAGTIVFFNLETNLQLNRSFLEGFGLGVCTTALVWCGCRSRHLN